MGYQNSVNTSGVQYTVKERLLAWSAYNSDQRLYKSHTRKFIQNFLVALAFSLCLDPSCDCSFPPRLQAFWGYNLYLFLFCWSSCPAQSPIRSIGRNLCKQVIASSQVFTTCIQIRYFMFLKTENLIMKYILSWNCHFCFNFQKFQS